MDVHERLSPDGPTECGIAVEPETQTADYTSEVTCLECRRSIALANMRESIGRDQVRAQAQAPANREGYPVHVGCGGEVTTVRDYHLETVSGILTEVIDHYHRCHGCGRDVQNGDVVRPEVTQ